MFISVVGGVFAAAALFGWMMHRSSKSMDRGERDPKYKRRLLYIGAAIYGYGLVAGVTQVLIKTPQKTNFCCGYRVADAKDVSNYGDAVLRIGNPRVDLLRFFLLGLRFFRFTLALAFNLEGVNQSIFSKLFCTSPTLKFRLLSASHRRVF